MFPIPKHDREMMEYFRELIESGEFKPVIDRTYPLDQIVEAYRYVETGQKIGNVVITSTIPTSAAHRWPTRRDWPTSSSMSPKSWIGIALVRWTPSP